MKSFTVLSLYIFLTVSAWAGIKVGTLNCFFLFDPAHPEKTSLKEKGPTAEQYVQKVDNLSSLIVGLDVVGVQEIGGKNDVEALAKAGKGLYRPYFTQGKDTYTGQDVGALVRISPTIKVLSAERNKQLEKLSKHLVVTLQEDKTRYAILVVHLIRPIGQSAQKHDEQLLAIHYWVESVQDNSPNTVIIVMGDFNNPDKGILKLYDSAEVSNFAGTHLDGKPFDRIFSTAKIENVEIVRPPYGKRPNDLNKTLWTDHYLLKAGVN